jgi:hypothetical protein
MLVPSLAFNAQLFIDHMLYTRSCDKEFRKGSTEKIGTDQNLERKKKERIR